MNKILSTHLTPSPFPFTRFIPSPLETLSPRRRRLRCLDHQFLLPPPFSSPPPPPFSFLLPLLYVQEAIPLRSPLLFSRSPLSCCAALKRLPPLLFTSVVPSVVISLSRFSRFSRDEAAFNFVEYNIARCSTWSVMGTCREKKKKKKEEKKRENSERITRSLFERNLMLPAAFTRHDRVKGGRGDIISLDPSDIDVRVLRAW